MNTVKGATRRRQISVNKADYEVLCRLARMESRTLTAQFHLLVKAAAEQCGLNMNAKKS